MGDDAERFGFGHASGDGWHAAAQACAAQLDPPAGANLGFVYVTLAVAWFICWNANFDVIARVVDPGGETTVGVFITAAIVAGGSAAAMTLFHDILKFTRSAREEIKKSAPPN